MPKDMLKNIIIKNINEHIYNSMPYLNLPQIVYAKVSKAEGVKVNLKILDNDLNIDYEFEELPDIKTDISCKIDDIVLVSFLRGELEHPIIIRRIS